MASSQFCLQMTFHILFSLEKSQNQLFLFQQFLFFELGTKGLNTFIKDHTERFVPMGPIPISVDYSASLQNCQNSQVDRKMKKIK